MTVQSSSFRLRPEDLHHRDSECFSPLSDWPPPHYQPERIFSPETESQPAQLLSFLDVLENKSQAIVIVAQPHTRSRQGSSLKQEYQLLTQPSLSEELSEIVILHPPSTSLLCKSMFLKKGFYKVLLYPEDIMGVEAISVNCL